MKKTTSRRTFWQSILSVLILFFFICIGFGSSDLFGLLGVPVGTYTIYDETSETYTQIIEGYKDVTTDTIWKQYTTGKKDSYGMWNGNTTITNTNAKKYSDGVSIKESVEHVNFINGKRDGQSLTFYSTSWKSSDGIDDDYSCHKTDTLCYDYGNVIPCSQLKNASLAEDTVSAFQVLQNNYPWYLGSLNLMGFTNEYVQAYMDTFETILNKETFASYYFNNEYDDVIEVLEDTPYDSIIQINTILTSSFGIEQMKVLEFRMAVIDQQRQKGIATFQVLKNSYPHYLENLETDIVYVNEPDFEVFCNAFDSIMATFSVLDMDDPFFVDSIDSRISTIVQTMYNSDKSAFALKKHYLKEMDMTPGEILEEANNILKCGEAQDKTPKDIAGDILRLMLRRYSNDGDVPKLAVLNAYQLRNNIIQIPTVTTSLNKTISENVVEFYGNVINNGGDEVQERGLVWAKYYNPTISDNKLEIGSGLGAFSGNIEFTSDSIYYIRSYAQNSEGVSYGNNIEFVAQSVSGLTKNTINESDFIIYPNPASSEVTLSFNANSSENYFAEMIDLRGKTVFKKALNEPSIGQNQIRLNVNTLQNGFYICRLTSETGNCFSQKIYVFH